MVGPSSPLEVQSPSKEEMRIWKGCRQREARRGGFSNSAVSRALSKLGGAQQWRLGFQGSEGNASLKAAHRGRLGSGRFARAHLPGPLPHFSLLPRCSLVGAPARLHPWDRSSSGTQAPGQNTHPARLPTDFSLPSSNPRSPSQAVSLPCQLRTRVF